ncbi:MAG: signal recognition particle-docking protein FtsY [Zetaproteobacteria bacterium]|nr:MAG: signal recognition particle-docking protein FtsY [Zetaproteobacteria bacterium]
MASIWSRLRHGMERSREGLRALLPVGGREQWSAAQWEAAEEAFILADCGVETALRLVSEARKRKFQPPLEALRSVMEEMLVPPVAPPFDRKPFVLLVVGVNGTGKTTTIGKLAAMWGAEGKRVVVGAADTFRAAAIDQLAVWVERSGAEIVRQSHGADPAAVAFDTIRRGVAGGFDVVIVDTAGRVQTDKGLMEELAKVRRVMGKALPGAPHAVWQVVDGGTGQNAVAQVERFRATAGTTGLIVTKLDGTAKGGVVLQLCDRFRLPVQYLGVGESLEDLMPFDGSRFTASLLPEVDREEPHQPRA